MALVWCIIDDSIVVICNIFLGVERFRVAVYLHEMLRYYLGPASVEEVLVLLLASAIFTA